jgi:hypothetical protein
MAATMQIELELGAARSIIGCLAGKVVELTIAGNHGAETIAALIDGQGQDIQDHSLVARRWDDERGRPTGDRFVVTTDAITRIVVY